MDFIWNWSHLYLILPENFSTAFMLFGVCCLMMFVGQIPFMLLFKMVSVLILVFCHLWTIVETSMPESMLKYIPRAMTWKERIADFNNKSELKRG